MLRLDKQNLTLVLLILIRKLIQLKPHLTNRSHRHALLSSTFGFHRLLKSRSLNLKLLDYLLEILLSHLKLLSITFQSIDLHDRSALGALQLIS